MGKQDRETRRHLTLRIAEHQGRSARTGARLFNPSFSPIRSHSLDLDRISMKAPNFLDTVTTILRNDHIYTKTTNYCLRRGSVS